MVTIKKTIIESEKNSLLEFTFRLYLDDIIRDLCAFYNIKEDELVRIITSLFWENRDFRIFFNDFFDIKNFELYPLPIGFWSSINYLSDLTIKEKQKNNIRYIKTTLKKDTVATFDEPDINEQTGMPVLRYCQFLDQVEIPAVIEGNGIIPWMLITPYEIMTAQKFIDASEGNVLLAGLGLGYVPYSVAIKPNVNSVVVLESNPDVISLFRSEILAQIKDESISSKINIIECNAIEHMVTEDLSGYDHINIDPWYDTTDMLYYYLIGLLLEERYPKVEFSYWIEKTLLIKIKSAIIQILFEKDPEKRLYSRDIYIRKDNNQKYMLLSNDRSIYSVFLEFAEELINTLDVTITTKKELDDFLSFDTIRNNLKSFAENRPDFLHKLGLEWNNNSCLPKEMLEQIIHKPFSN